MMIKGKDVYVVFEDGTSLWWLRFLRHTYRHCRAFIKITPKIYIELNPLSNQMFLFVHIFDNSRQFYKVIHKMNYVKTRIENAPLKTAPAFCFTCVEAIKRLLGIHNFWIITPYDLYTYLISCRKKILTN